MTSDDPVHEAFGLVADARTRVIILGSLPGRQSLDARRYYANPRNQFWRLIGPVIGIDLVPITYEDRLAALLDAGVGLWDVIGAARRKGSLDSAIRDVEVRDLKAMVEALPILRALGFNGGTSYKVWVRQIGFGRPIALVPLPSSSSAYATAIEKKRPAWEALGSYLDGN